jgi:hypothetical protein
MAERQRQLLSKQRRKERHAARQILRCFCACPDYDLLTRIHAGWLAGEECIRRHPRHVAADWLKSRAIVWRTNRHLPRRHIHIRKETPDDNPQVFN